MRLQQLENALVSISQEPAIAVPPTLFLSDADVERLADWPSAVRALRDAYSSKMKAEMVPPRSMARGDGLWLRGLTAVSPSGRYMGCKLIAASIKGRRASYLVSLFDQNTMGLSALIDGNKITGIRTASAAAVALDCSAPDRPLRIAVIGSGFEARRLLAAVAAVRAVEQVRVFSPSPQSRQSFIEAMRQELGLVIADTQSPQEAVCGADVVLCAARSRDETPVLLGKWLEPGMTVVSIGSTLPEQREVDHDVIARAALIVADMVEEVMHDTGDMRAASKEGVPVDGKVVSLSDLVLGNTPLRKPGDIVLYKSVGSALQDIVMAEMLFTSAQAQGIGTLLPQSIVPVSK